MGWVIILLLVIAAVLLFGRGAVLGVAGAAAQWLGGVAVLTVVIAVALTDSGKTAGSWALGLAFTAMVIALMVAIGRGVWDAVSSLKSRQPTDDWPSSPPPPAILYPGEAGRGQGEGDEPTSFFAAPRDLKIALRRIRGDGTGQSAPVPVPVPVPSRVESPSAPLPPPTKHRPPPAPQIMVDSVEPPDDDDDDERVIVMDGLRKRMELAYVDAAGAATDRIVQVRRVSLFRRTPYIEGVCELRHEWRRFRVSRCREIIDLDTGEVRTGAELVDDIASEWDGPIKP